MQSVLDRMVEDREGELVEARKRIAELEAIVQSQSGMLHQIAEAAGYATGETYSGYGIINRLREQGRKT